MAACHSGQQHVMGSRHNIEDTTYEAVLLYKCCTYAVRTVTNTLYCKNCYTHTVHSTCPGTFKLGKSHDKLCGHAELSVQPTGRRETWYAVYLGMGLVAGRCKKAAVVVLGVTAASHLLF